MSIPHCCQKPYPGARKACQLKNIHLLWPTTSVGHKNANVYRDDGEDDTEQSDGGELGHKLHSQEDPDGHDY